ncbi:hypothetical protein MMC22_011690 [Lobaria immixta]|nr:hypothetical protein [Lobaria immixta]
MRLQFLAILCSLFLLALAGVEDNIRINELIDAVNFYEDAKDWDSLNRLFLPNATYTIFDEDVQVDFVRGIVAIKAVISGSVTGNHYPFDPLGSAAKANATTYLTITFFGRGAQEGQTKFIFAVNQDTFVKTGDFRKYGGWKFSSRVFTNLAPGIGNPTLSPPRNSSTRYSGEVFPPCVEGTSLLETVQLGNFICGKFWTVEFGAKVSKDGSN